MSNKTKFKAFGLSHVGRKRRGNEDSFLLASGATPAFVVSDGMGGMGGGEIASALVVESFRRFSGLVSATRAPAEAAAAEILKGADQAVRAVARTQDREQARVDLGLLGQPQLDLRPAIAPSADLDNARRMGATAVVLVLAEGKAHVLWAGDSRCYRLRGGKLTQLTEDHSLEQQIRKSGGDAGGYYSNVLVNAIGSGGSEDGRLVVDRHSESFKSGDVYLLCSDGLTGEVPDAVITNVLVAVDADFPPEEAANTLIDKANENGGRDNITCIVVQIQ